MLFLVSWHCVGNVLVLSQEGLGIGNLEQSNFVKDVWHPCCPRISGRDPWAPGPVQACLILTARSACAQACESAQGADLPCCAVLGLAAFSFFTLHTKQMHTRRTRTHTHTYAHAHNARKHARGCERRGHQRHQDREAREPERAAACGL